MSSDTSLLRQPSLNMSHTGHVHPEEGETTWRVTMTCVFGGERAQQEEEEEEEVTVTVELTVRGDEEDGEGRTFNIT